MVPSFGLYDMFLGLSLIVFSSHAPVCYSSSHIWMLLGLVILRTVGRSLLTLFLLMILSLLTLFSLVILSLPGRYSLHFPV